MTPAWGDQHIHMLCVDIHKHYDMQHSMPVSMSDGLSHLFTLVSLSPLLQIERHTPTTCSNHLLLFASLFASSCLFAAIDNHVETSPAPCGRNLSVPPHCSSPINIPSEKELYLLVWGRRSMAIFVWYFFMPKLVINFFQSHSTESYLLKYPLKSRLN